jgi:hypothetical protein
VRARIRKDCRQCIINSRIMSGVSQALVHRYCNESFGVWHAACILIHTRIDAFSIILDSGFTNYACSGLRETVNLGRIAILGVCPPDAPRALLPASPNYSQKCYEFFASPAVAPPCFFFLAFNFSLALLRSLFFRPDIPCLHMSAYFA